MMAPGDTVLLPDEAATITFGRELAQSISTPWVIALSGELGAGKTTLVKGIVEGLHCIDAAASPTFAIVHRYAGERPLVHCDWYRIERERELVNIGWDEIVDNEERIVVEWAEKFPELLPRSTRFLHLAYRDGGRTITAGSGW
ncbi:MAG: tRNA (adenosine(37)-N6)-threonylcarbamoyltransferase complex ATPase subunit type 1 TsaE [bacterium]|nr:tRNA (adenosine(37)-N6)-threonylcarbamoyltransferase complex ATPase subunit type 1 TsaE [bacterium]